MISIVTDDGDGFDYDKALEELHHSQGGDIVEVITKCAGTQGGRPCVMIRFMSADAPGNTSHHLVACFMTLRELLACADALRARHGNP